MAISDAFVASISGVWDKFDNAVAVADWVEKLLKTADLPLELHNPAKSPAAEFFGAVAEAEACVHIYDPTEDYKEELQRARDLVNEARLICQKVLAAI